MKKNRVLLKLLRVAAVRFQLPMLGQRSKQADTVRSLGPLSEHRQQEAETTLKVIGAVPKS